MFCTSGTWWAQCICWQSQTDYQEGYIPFCHKTPIEVGLRLRQGPSKGGLRLTAGRKGLVSLERVKVCLLWGGMELHVVDDGVSELWGFLP